MGGSGSNEQSSGIKNTDAEIRDGVLSDSTKFAGGNIDAAISSRSQLSNSEEQARVSQGPSSTTDVQPATGSIFYQNFFSEDFVVSMKLQTYDGTNTHRYSQDNSTNSWGDPNATAVGQDVFGNSYRRRVENTNACGSHTWHRTGVSQGSKLAPLPTLDAKHLLLTSYRPHRYDEDGNRILSLARHNVIFDLNTEKTLTEITETSGKRYWKADYDKGILTVIPDNMADGGEEGYPIVDAIEAWSHMIGLRDTGHGFIDEIPYTKDTSVVALEDDPKDDISAVVNDKKRKDGVIWDEDNHEGTGKKTWVHKWSSENVKRLIALDQGLKDKVNKLSSSRQTELGI